MCCFKKGTFTHAFLPTLTLHPYAVGSIFMPILHVDEMKCQMMRIKCTEQMQLLRKLNFYFSEIYSYQLLFKKSVDSPGNWNHNEMGEINNLKNKGKNRAMNQAKELERIWQLVNV